MALCLPEPGRLLTVSRGTSAPCAGGWHTGSMAFDTRRWVDPSQPQTLQFSCWLLYANAVVGFLLGGSAFLLGGPILGLLGLAGCVLAGYGIANEKRWGYFLAVVLAGLEVLLYVVAAGGIVDAISSPVLIPLAFAVALFALLLHPQSRDYQRIWFK